MAAARTKSSRPPLGLLPEALKVALWRGFAGVRRWYRSTWLYRLLLTGPLADRVAFQPHDTLPRRLDDADALLRGRFKFEGEVVDANDRSIFERPSPSADWLEALHGFDWLPPLSAAGGDAARTLATNLITQWLKRNAKYSEPGWLPQVMGRRLTNIFAHGRFVLSNSEMLWRSKVFVSLREQSRMLARVVGEAPDGLPALEAAAALALSGACMSDSPKRLYAGLARLEDELGRQILPDGGHLSRSPENLVMAFRQVAMVMEALSATSNVIPQGLRSAHDRMAPMIRFFRHGDGALALFNGGAEGDARMIAALLQRDDVKGQPFAYARHSGYHRLTANRTLVIFDCGTPPPGAYSTGAHAGCLAFELSAGPQRIVVNCGSAALACHRRWEAALRATAAHSTATVSDTSSAVVIRDGWVKKRVGPRLIHGPQNIETRRVDTEKGTVAIASHDGYMHPFGIRHERELTLSPQGLALTGSDRIVPVRERRQAIGYALRFHLHPDVRVSSAQSGDIILKLANGEGWRFRSSMPAVIEESVYLGNDAVRRTEQIVVGGQLKNETAEIGWFFEQIVGG
ncbi:MAG TPA: heparinase II/III family protein [Rhizomicrobium sp.]|nr:heparinase II/III family protein [Rhizomicrobium sp.]